MREFSNIGKSTTSAKFILLANRNQIFAKPVITTCFGGLCKFVYTKVCNVLAVSRITHVRKIFLWFTLCVSSMDSSMMNSVEWNREICRFNCLMCAIEKWLRQH